MPFKSTFITLLIAVAAIAGIYFLQQSTRNGIECGDFYYANQTITNPANAQNAEDCFWNNYQRKTNTTIRYVETQEGFLRYTDYTYNNIFGQDILFKRQTVGSYAGTGQAFYESTFCHLPTKNSHGDILITGCGSHDVSLYSTENCSLDENGACEINE